MNVPQEARALEWRLTLAYVSAFGVALLVFAIAMHVAFVLDVKRDQSTRLDGLLAEGGAAFKLKHGDLDVDVDGAALSNPSAQGIAWYDRSGRLLAQEGAVADVAAPPQVGTRTANGVLWRVKELPGGYVQAEISLAQDGRSLTRVDLGLAIGFLCALVAAGFGGRYLASQAIARIVATMRTLRNFTADAAHELRGPLAALQSNADASLRDPSVMAPEHRRRLERIDATARTMARTADDLLLIARAGTPLERELFAIDLDACVARAVETRVAIARDKGVALRAQSCGRSRIYGDPNEIDRIFGNLIDNAIRFTPPGGSVDVRCSVERGGVAVHVDDTGVGIAASDFSNVFERFWRGDPVRARDAGTGLGLAIVRALVQRHGGTVEVASMLGSGSHFTVWFPARPPKPSLLDAAAPRRWRAGRRGCDAR